MRIDNLNKTKTFAKLLFLFFFLFLMGVRAQISNTFFDDSQIDRTFPFLHFSTTENRSAFNFSSIVYTNDAPYNFNRYQFLSNLKLNVYKKVLSFRNYQLAFSGMIESQFLTRREESNGLTGIRNTAFNTDYFFFLHNEFNVEDTHFFRINLYHRSSHVGDDFILLNNIKDDTFWSNDESNFEAIDLQYVYKHPIFNAHIGTTIIVRTDSTRKKIGFQQGVTIYAFPFFEPIFLQNFYAGYEVRFLQNNNYNPDINIGIGYAFQKSTLLQLEYYVGNIPYSRFEKEIHTSWIALGLYFNLEI